MRRPIYCYTEVQAPYEAVAARFCGDARLWLPPPGERAGDGWLVGLDTNGLLPAWASPTVLAVVTVEPPLPAPSEDVHIRPLTWRAAVVDALFPTLTGDLEIASIAPQAVHLALMGSYRPPLSVVGEAGDRLIGGRVAEAVVHRFLLRIAERLGDVSPPGP